MMGSLQKSPKCGCDFFSGKFAWNLKFEDEVESDQVNRGERNTAEYVPTFFTAPQHHAALTAAARYVPI